MSGVLRLHLAEEGADARRLGVLAGYLRAELLQLDVEAVALPESGPSPQGARGFGVSVGALIVALGQSADGLRSVVSAVRDWLRRGDGIRTVRLEIDGDVLELSHASTGEQARLIDLFVSRHVPAAGA